MVWQLVLRSSLTAVSLIAGACEMLDRDGQIAINKQAWRKSKARMRMCKKKAISWARLTNQDERTRLEKRNEMNHVESIEQDAPIKARRGQPMKWWQSHRPNNAGRTT